MEENQALRESNAQAASGDRGSLQEQVTRVGKMLTAFARTGQSGADQTLILRHLGQRAQRTISRVFGNQMRGGTLRQLCGLMLQSIFTNNLAVNTTWTGVGDKVCFHDMFLKTIVQRAIRKNPATQDATDEAVQVQVMSYLKGASDREGRRRRRTAERDPQPTT
ncbi:hypothetical protein UPYG_G00341680 [Umbra pygmaea]|uniref:DUF4806 domain-containing protein n=1 Tax=Umbra pygmaea TaxID=75934 RepID=A0ABD0WDF0_UMBPY